MKTSVYFALLLVLAAPFGSAQTPAAKGAPPAPVKVTSVEGITEYHLANGLDVLLFPDPSKPVVTVNVTYKVGSRNEGYGESGMAHLLEHMLFKGTQKYDSIMKLLTEHGSSNWNGTTWYDRTNYFETLDARTDDNLRWALEMESDRMVNSRVAKKDLDTEMTVVRNEFERGENDPGSVLEERLMSTAYLWHNYGKATIGPRSDIEHVPIEKLQAFYRKYYQPDNSVLTIAGKFDETKTLAWVNELFGAIPKPARVLDTTYTQEPAQDGMREVELRRVGDTQQLLLGYHIPAASDPDTTALEVLSYVLGDEPAGRLYKTLIKPKLATSMSASEYQLHDPGMFLVHVEMRKTQNFAKVEKTVYNTIDDIVKHPPSKEEVNRAKTKILKEFQLALNDSAGIARELSENIGAGDWRLLFLDRDRVERVASEDLVRVAKTYLINSNLTVGRFYPVAKTPQRAEVPAVGDVSAIFKDYTGKGPIQEGEPFDASPAAIEKRLTRVTLPNGIKLVLLPKKTRGATVVADLAFHWGTLESLKGKSGAAGAAGSMLMRGTTKHTRQQIQDEADQLKAQISVGGDVDGASASVQTIHSGLAGSLRLIAEMLQHSTFPKGDFDEVKQAQLAGIEASRSEPATIARTARDKHVNRYPLDDPRASLSPEEEIARIKATTLQQAKAFYSAFYGGSNAEISVVGDFDPKEIQPLVAELFGKWKSPKPYKRIPEEYKPVAATDKTMEAPDKANAYLFAIVQMGMDQQDADYPYVYLANTIFGEDTKSRVWRRIREKDGLSYGTNTGFRASSRDKLASFTLGSTFAPQNVDKVEAAFKDELAKVLREGFTKDELEIAKDAKLKERQGDRADDSFLAGLFTSQAELGRTMQREIDLEDAYRSATIEQLDAALRKWLKPESISYFKAGDFKKAGVTK